MKYEYNCLMAEFDIPDWGDLVKQLIDPTDIYDNDDHEYGLELDPHTTILWGIAPDVKLTSFQKKLPAPINISIDCSAISIFESDEYDVVKFDINSPILHKIHNELIKIVPNTQTFPTYVPHMTIAYVKAGTGKKYIKSLKNSIELLAYRYKYSTTDGKYKYLYDKNFK